MKINKLWSKRKKKRIKRKTRKHLVATLQPLGHVWGAEHRKQQILARVFIAESRSASPLSNIIWTGMKLLDASGELQLCRCCRCWPTYQSEHLFLRPQNKLNSHIWKLAGKFDSSDQSVSVKSDLLKENFPLEGASNTLAAATSVPH